MKWIPYDDVGDRERAHRLASSLGVTIPEGIDLHMWSLPILEALLERMERLESTVYRDLED